MTSTEARIYPLFPQTPFTQENDERDSQSVTNSVTDYSQARARAREENEDFVRNDVADYYCQAFGVGIMPPVAKAACLRALDAGMDQSLIYLAIDEASVAPRPSWNYAAAILRRLLQENCLTGEQYIERQDRFHARRRY